MSATNVRLNPRTADLTGERFGLLRVIAFAGYSPRAWWLCQCDCGRRKTINAHELIRRHAVSCGCKSQQIKKNAVERQPEFECYSAMIDRCHNPRSKNYSNYSGRGIKVCEKWRQGFWFFIEDVGRRPSPAHSLDRFPDTNGDYEPGNVRWATAREQQLNRRVNRFIEHAGERLTIVEWAERTGISRRTIQIRIDRLRWSVERALTEPSGAYRNKPTCLHGYLKTAKNRYVDSRGKSHCRVCNRIRMRKANRREAAR
jgi:hypothetical protein